MSKLSHVGTLQQLALLDPLSPALQELIADIFDRASDESTLSDGQIIYTEGTPSDGTGAILVEGKVSITRGGEDPLDLIAPALLGEMYQFNPHAARTATVQARGPVRILEFAWSRFNQMARRELSPGDQARLVQAMEEYAFRRLPDTPLLNLHGLRSLPRRTLLRTSLALFWIADRQSRVDGEVLFAAGTPTRGEAFLLLEGNTTLVQGGHALEVMRGPALLGPLVRAGEEAFWNRTGRVSGHAITLHFMWPDYIGHLESVLPHDALEEALRTLAACVDQRC